MQDGQNGGDHQPGPEADGWSSLPGGGDPPGRAAGAAAPAEPGQAVPGQTAAFGPAAAFTQAEGHEQWAPPGGYGQAAGQPGGYGQATGQPGGYGQAAGQPGGYGQAAGQPGGYGSGGYGPGDPGPGDYGSGGYSSGGYGSGGYGQGWGPPPLGGHGQPGGYSRPPRRGGRFLVYSLVAVIAAGAGAAAAVVTLQRGTTPQSGVAGVSPQQVPAPGNAPGGTSNTSAINEQAVAARVEPGVVDITSRLHYTGQVFEGTGMILSSSGLVLTNNHVVSGSTKLTVTLVKNGRQYPASVIGTDARDDIALLKLQGASGLRPVRVGDSSKMTLGAPVVALGNAGGIGGTPTVTSGTITALDRTITASDSGSGTSETLHNMLQTNAHIAEGDSGGPLANANGQVIGMDTAANTQNIGGPGSDQGFAIPINRALLIARQMAAGHGNASIRIGLPPFMGVAVANLPAGAAGTPQQQLQQLRQVAMRYGGGINSTGNCLANNGGNPVPSQIAPISSGTLIAGVFCNAPAKTTGLTGGDVITAVDGHRVTVPSSLTQVLTSYHPGNTVTVTWTDTSGKQHTGSLKLAAGPAK